MPRLKVEFRLPGLSVGVDDIRVSLGSGKRERWRKNREAGPYLIVARSCGLALETGSRSDPGSTPVVWAPHARRHQLWYLRPSGVEGEAFIVSAATGLVLDSTVPITDGIVPVIWERNGEPWQRWRIEDAPDETGYFLQSVHNRRYLATNKDAVNGWTPWFEERNGHEAQQWIIALPHGHHTH